MGDQLAHLNAPAAPVPLMFLRVRQQSPNASCKILPLVTSIAPSHASSEDVRQVRSANMLASQASACTQIPMRSPARHLTLSSHLKNRLPSEQAIVPFCRCQRENTTASTLASPQHLARNSLWGCFRTFFAGEPLLPQVPDRIAVLGRHLIIFFTFASQA